MNIELLKEIAVEAGNEILKIYHDERLSKEIENKSDNSPLTLADKASNKVIVSSLSTSFPGNPHFVRRRKTCRFC
jgi:3'(2'), 5'-bisphosphate nucleotidase